MKKYISSSLLGFTLIELLVVIAVIGILSTIVLVSTNGAREDAKEASALSQMRSAQTAVTRCLNKGKVMYCRGQNEAGGFSNTTYGDGEVDCVDSQWNVGSPAMGDMDTVYENSALCGEEQPQLGNPFPEQNPDYSFGTWPDLSEVGFRYGSHAGSNYQKGIFAYFAYESAEKPIRTVICCTQNGCTRSEMTEAALNFYYTLAANGASSAPQTNFCRLEANNGSNFTED